jgi:hypothetical protein
MARGSKGGSTGSLDVVRAVTAVPCMGQRRKKVVVGFQGSRLKPWSNRLACLVVARGSATASSKVGRANLGQQAGRESASIAHRRRATPPGRCRQSRRCLLRWLDLITRQMCGRESTAEACASRPDFADALRNSVPFLASPPAFDQPHAARSKLQCRFSLTFET